MQLRVRYASRPSDRVGRLELCRRRPARAERSGLDIVTLLLGVPGCAASLAEE